MLKYLKKFKTTSQYNNYISDTVNFIKPNVSLCEDAPTTIYYNPYVPETKLVAKFNVTSTSEPTRIIGIMKSSIYYASSIEIDGVEQPSVVIGYTFSTTGKHTVKYTLADDSTFSTMIAFCTDMTEVIIPDTVTSIHNSALQGCSALMNVIIPNSVTSIGNYAFSNCSSLTSIAIPDSVTTIGVQAFQECSGLMSINIPSGVTSIGDGLLVDCNALSSITVDNSNTVYDSKNNCNAIIETNTNKLIAGCKNTIIQNKVTSINIYAFYGCTGLTSINIPSSVTNIGNYAFYGCIGLTSITINAITPPTLGTNVFNNTNDCQIYVPSDSVDAYKAASGWSSYASRIQPIA